MNGEFSTLLLKNSKQNRKRLLQSSTSSPSSTSSTASSSDDQKIIQDALMDSIFDLCQEMKTVSNQMNDDLKSDAVVLDNMSENVNRNRAQVQRVSKEVERATQQQRRKTCISFSTLLTVLIIYYLTKIIITLVPPHPFGLK